MIIDAKEKRAGSAILLKIVINAKNKESKSNGNAKKYNSSNAKNKSKNDAKNTVMLIINVKNEAWKQKCN